MGVTQFVLIVGIGIGWTTVLVFVMTLLRVARLADERIDAELRDVYGSSEDRLR
jgi:hypothetical protein